MLGAFGTILQQLDELIGATGAAGDDDLRRGITAPRRYRASIAVGSLAFSLSSDRSWRSLSDIVISLFWIVYLPMLMRHF